MKVLIGTKNPGSTGGIGLLTKEHMTRIDLNTQAFTMALTQFVNGEVWTDKQ